VQDVPGLVSWASFPVPAVCGIDDKIPLSSQLLSTAEKAGKASLSIASVPSGRLASEAGSHVPGGDAAAARKSSNDAVDVRRIRSS